MVPVGWLLAVLLLALLGLYVRGLVGRLDRLHLRVEAAMEALDVQLLRRSSLVRELAESGWLDPASSLLLADGAVQANRADAAGRAAAESGLSGIIRSVLEQPGNIDDVVDARDGASLLHELAAACERVVLARRFANEAVRSTTALRERVVVRALRLAGHAKMPLSFEMDDAPPAELAQFVDPRP